MNKFFPTIAVGNFTRVIDVTENQVRLNSSNVDAKYPSNRTQSCEDHQFGVRKVYPVY